MELLKHAAISAHCTVPLSIALSIGALDKFIFKESQVSTPSNDEIDNDLVNDVENHFVNDKLTLINVDKPIVNDETNLNDADNPFVDDEMLKEGIRISKLSNDGFEYWSHFTSRVTEHEISVKHLKNIATWYELRLRFNQGQTVDKTAQKILEKEKENWRNMFVGIVSVVKFLAKKNLAFRGSKENLYNSSNGNFSDLIEMLAEFDHVVQEDVRRIRNDELHSHYHGHNIQNGLILELASKIKCEITEEKKEAKYFSVILDRTPDCSHEK
ncbi:uncharacterized protein LOC136080145 [Hydra vulgaris]|uniref:Uncharacterized protein LOC136080145 n=1 Tax=Hydra vulgaris TaxID=6087 RepID=A0ABM4BUH9_HYDVU